MSSTTGKGTTMTIDILGNADAYLFFNEAREPMCSRCFQHRNRARVVYIEGREDPYPANASGITPLHIEVDGMYVRFGQARCGVHDRSYSRQYKVSPSLISGDRMLDFDLLRRAYIEARDRDRQRQQAQHDDYVAGLRRIAEMSEDQFSIEYKTLSEARGNATEVTISGPNGSDMVPISRVSLTNDYGVWGVQVIDFSGHTGRGRGSPALARIIGRLMLVLADSADELNGVKR